LWNYKLEITVLKFGGTSVGTPIAIKESCNRVKECHSEVKIVVLSAFAGTTDLILHAINNASTNLQSSRDIITKIKEMHLKIISDLFVNIKNKLLASLMSKIEELELLCVGINYIGELTPKITDKALAFGELISTEIVTEYFNSNDLPATLFDSRQFIKTESKFNIAEVNFQQTIEAFSSFELSKNGVYIFQGFIASDKQNNTTTLGRGGSDYSASIIGYALQQNNLQVAEIQIWTDVDGIMTADPKINPEAKTISEISFAEVLELSYFGAKVIHPNTVKPAVENKIPVSVRNTFNPSNNGTKISTDRSAGKCVTVIIKDTILLSYNDNKQEHFYDNIHKILKILENTNSYVLYQSFSVSTFQILFKRNEINLNDYLDLKNITLNECTTIAIVGKQRNKEISQYSANLQLSGHSRLSSLIIELK